MSQHVRHFSCTARFAAIGLSSLAFALPVTASAEGFVDDAKATLNPVSYTHLRAHETL